MLPNTIVPINSFKRSIGTYFTYVWRSSISDKNTSLLDRNLDYNKIWIYVNQINCRSCKQITIVFALITLKMRLTHTYSSNSFALFHRCDVVVIVINCNHRLCTGWILFYFVLVFFLCLYLQHLFLLRLHFI